MDATIMRAVLAALLTQRALEYSASEALALAEEYHAALRMNLKRKPSYDGPCGSGSRKQSNQTRTNRSGSRPMHSLQVTDSMNKGQRPRGPYRNEILLRLANERGGHMS